MSTYANNGNKILQPGKASFEIVSVFDKDQNAKPLISKAGNPMLKLKLLVTDEMNESTTVWDYILLNFPKKVTAFLQAIHKSELLQDIHHQTFNANVLLGNSGACTIKTDTHEVYGTKTVIGWYLKPANTQEEIDLSKTTAQYKSEIIDDTNVPLSSYSFDKANIEPENNDYPF